MLINQSSLDEAVSDLFVTVRSVYEFLTEEDNIKNIDNTRDNLAKLARVISDSALFIKDYSATKSFYMSYPLLDSEIVGRCLPREKNRKEHFLRNANRRRWPRRDHNQIDATVPRPRGLGLAG